MKRVLAVILLTLPVLIMPVADTYGQAPTTKITISGFMDNVTSYSRNMSVHDLNVGNRSDTEWYARTRTRPDITAELGTTKFVLGFEIDTVWGQTGSADTNVALGASAGGAPQHFGSTSGLDLNTDTQGIIELKWAYTEFDFPAIPFKTRVRLGAQPWAAHYKAGLLAHGDFPGAHVVMTFSPMIRWHVTYAQVEEESTGRQDGFVRGEDFAIVTSVEISPFKGLDIRPIYAFLFTDGNTSSSARGGRGGVANAAPAAAAGGLDPIGGFRPGFHESRHTIGVDARWRIGPFNLDPTVLYQWGSRDLFTTGYGEGEQKRSAWFIDVRGGFQVGSFLIEPAVAYMTGNRAQDDIRNPRVKLNFYEPISTDSGYYGLWAEHFALGIDYFNGLHTSTAPGLSWPNGISHDKYGLARVGFRASYGITPAFTVRTAANSTWTAHSVDTSTRKVAASGRAPIAGVTDFRGDSSYMGTEIDLGFQWRFAPGVAFDLVGAYTFLGEGMDAVSALNPTANVVRAHGEAKDIQSISARVRYSF
jgi:hypothetical protein